MSSRWPPTRPSIPEIELYPAFDTTLTSGLDETVRNLKTLRHRAQGDEEANRWQLQAFEDLRAEVLSLRASHATLVEGLNKKASLSAQRKFEAALTERIDKRIDIIRNVACWAIGVLVVVMGLIKVIK
jgi:hypothetical protein